MTAAGVPRGSESVETSPARSHIRRKVRQMAPRTKIASCLKSRGRRFDVNRLDLESSEGIELFRGYGNCAFGIFAVEQSVLWFLRFAPPAPPE